MKRSSKTVRITFIVGILLIFSALNGFPQKGLTLDEALRIAETNSPTMQRTRLSLVRSQENLNA